MLTFWATQRQSPTIWRRIKFFRRGKASLRSELCSSLPRNCLRQFLAPINIWEGESLPYVRNSCSSLPRNCPRQFLAPINIWEGESLPYVRNFCSSLPRNCLRQFLATTSILGGESLPCVRNYVPHYPEIALGNFWRQSIFGKGKVFPSLQTYGFPLPLLRDNSFFNCRRRYTPRRRPFSTPATPNRCDSLRPMPTHMSF